MTQKRHEILVDSFYKSEYKYNYITLKPFKEKYITHVKDVLIHIEKNQHRTTFLTSYFL